MFLIFLNYCHIATSYLKLVQMHIGSSSTDTAIWNSFQYLQTRVHANKQKIIVLRINGLRAELTATLWSKTEGLSSRCSYEWRKIIWQAIMAAPSGSKVSEFSRRLSELYITRFPFIAAVVFAMLCSEREQAKKWVRW